MSLGAKGDDLRTRAPRTERCVPATCGKCGNDTLVTENQHRRHIYHCPTCVEKVRAARAGRKTVDQRFFEKVHMTDGCWLWMGHRNSTNYGTFRDHGKTQLAHRVAYERIVGPIPEGLVIDHLCRNPPCVRPDHMETVTNYVNTIIRGVWVRRTPPRVQALHRPVTVLSPREPSD